MGRVGDSRGKERRAVHQGAVVVVADEVVRRRGFVTRCGFVCDGDAHCVVGVVEVDDVNVEHKHSRTGDDITWRDNVIISSP